MPSAPITLDRPQVSTSPAHVDPRGAVPDGRRGWMGQLILHAIRDPDNALYRYRRRRAWARVRRWPAWRRALALAAAIGLAVGLLVAVGWSWRAGLADRVMSVAATYFGAIMAGLIAASAVHGLTIGAGAYARWVRSATFEQWRLTRLTDGQLARGALVPSLAGGWGFLGVALVLLAPGLLAGGGLHWVNRLLPAMALPGLVANLFALPWIVFGSLVRGAKLPAVIAVALPVLMMDPVILTCLSLSYPVPAGSLPLAYGLAWLAAAYPTLKGLMAYATIKDLHESLSEELRG